jgi:hypothetical protein
MNNFVPTDETETRPLDLRSEPMGDVIKSGPERDAAIEAVAGMDESAPFEEPKLSSQTYQVVWETDEEAVTPEEAARAAWQNMLSIVDCLVIDEEGEAHKVNLSNFIHGNGTESE